MTPLTRWRQLHCQIGAASLQPSNNERVSAGGKPPPHIFVLFYQVIRTAATTRRPFSRVYSQVDRQISLSP